jgi:hypothetical protein
MITPLTTILARIRTVFAITIYDDSSHDNFSHDEARRLHDDFSDSPRDHYPRPHEYGYFYPEGRPGEEFEEHYRGQRPPQHFERPAREGQREGQLSGGPEVAADNKRPNSISLPQASSIDLASASLPPRALTEVPGAFSNRLMQRHGGSHGMDGSANAGQLGTREDESQSSNAGPNISSLFSELSTRDDSTVQAREAQDIALPVPGAMNLGHFETRERKANEVNEIAVEDKRTNPVEKLVTL